jgi:hypothetical protein
VSLLLPQNAGIVAIGPSCRISSTARQTICSAASWHQCSRILDRFEEDLEQSPGRYLHDAVAVVVWIVLAQRNPSGRALPVCYRVTNEAALSLALSGVAIFLFLRSALDAIRADLWHLSELLALICRVLLELGCVCREETIGISANSLPIRRCAGSSQQELRYSPRTLDSLHPDSAGGSFFPIAQ